MQLKVITVILAFVMSLQLKTDFQVIADFAKLNNGLKHMHIDQNQCIEIAIDLNQKHPNFQQQVKHQIKGLKQNKAKLNDPKAVKEFYKQYEFFGNETKDFWKCVFGSSKKCEKKLTKFMDLELMFYKNVTHQLRTFRHQNTCMADNQEQCHQILVSILESDPDQADVLQEQIQKLQDDAEELSDMSIEEQNEWMEENGMFDEPINQFWDCQLGLFEMCGDGESEDELKMYDGEMDGEQISPELHQIPNQQNPECKGIFKFFKKQCKKEHMFYKLKTINSDFVKIIGQDGEDGEDGEMMMNQEKELQNLKFKAIIKRFD